MDNNDWLIFDEWISNVVKKKSYCLYLSNKIIESLSNSNNDDCKYLNDILKGNVYVFTKVSTEKTEQVKFIEKLGFNLIDTNVSFEKNLSPILDFKFTCNVLLARPVDEEKTVELASRTMRNSRFHLDKCFEQSTADYLKGEWVRNYFKGKRGDAMVIALEKDKIVGFLQLIKSNGNKLFIDLIGVDSSIRNKGIASNMIHFAESEFKDCEKYVVGTQVSNIPSIRLYEKLGFKMISSNYVFHYHN
ncbi:MAG: GNAT family N-acetyltransferase [Bacteroidia bacterium]|nr:GNAT family N-acetyltransferase [Bacteroidia bacterium]